MTYFPRGGEPVTLKATREQIETASSLESGTPQSFRQVAFSFSAGDLKTAGGETITPRRGDYLEAGDGIYRLIEFDGLAARPRFDAGFSGRVLVYFEREVARNA